MAGNAMVMISFKKIWSMSFTVAPLILRIAISFRRRFTSSFVYPINPMKTISKVTMPPIMTESRNFREEVYPSSISLLKEITLSSLSGMSCPIRSCVLRRASEERLWYRMTICWAAPFV